MRSIVVSHRLGSLVVLLAATLVLSGCDAAHVSPTGAVPSSSTVSTATRPPASFSPPASSQSTPAPTASPRTWTITDLPEYSTFGGADLALGIDGTTEHIHVVVSNLEEAYHGWDASAYLRSADGGGTWSSSIMIPGTFPQVAADNRHVYLAYLAYGCGGIGVQHSARAGTLGSWSKVRCLTDTSDGGSDYAPTLAASADAVYVAALPDPRHVAVWSSRDNGRTWRETPIATRPKGSEVGWPGAVDVAATGSLVAVAWEDGRGTVQARISDDRGDHWSPPETLGTGGVTSAAGLDARLALSGAGLGGGWVASWTGATGWTTGPAPGAAPENEMDPFPGVAIVMGPDGAMGAFGSTCTWDGTNGVYVGGSQWTMSFDNGKTWVDTTSVAGCFAPMPLVWSHDGRVLGLAEGEEGYALVVGR